MNTAKKSLAIAVLLPLAFATLVRAQNEHWMSELKADQESLERLLEHTNALEYHMKDGTLAALNNTRTYAKPWLVLLATIKVHEDKMLARARSGYSAATELANELVRRDGLDYRTAHDVVQTFILESVRQGLPSCEAKIEILQAAAQEVVGSELSISEEQVRQALDPVHFVKVTNCRGGVAPEEVARMIEVRRKRLAEARARHLARIEKLEQSRAKLLADLKKLCEEPHAEQP